jgi:multidrug efflux pump subunit AcrA (membrane-fusion protein)
MNPSAHRALWWGLGLGILLCLLVLAGLHLAGFHFMRMAQAPIPQEGQKPLCYVSPKDPTYIREKPGKDPEGLDLIPVYPSQATAATTGTSQESRKIKYWVSPMDPKQVSDKPGKDPMGMDLVPVYEDQVPAAAPKKERKIKYWFDHMNPSIICDKPGKAPCGMDLVPVYEDEAEALGVISVPAQTLQSMGVRTAKVEVRPLARTIRAVGRVTYDERRLAQVTTKVNGWVDRLFVKVTGDPIHQGQPLLSIYSPELVSTQQEYLLALKNLKSLENAPYPELGDSARRLLDASRRRLEYWDIPPSQIKALEKTGEVKKDLALTSPVHGIVIKRLVTQGQMVQAGMPLLEVADLTEVWVEADIYEYELPWVKVGEKAQMTLSYLPGETFTGKIEYLYPYLKGSTRTVKLRLRFANPGLKLKPEMFAEVEIKSPLTAPVVAVPAEAVIDTGEKQHVFVALGQGRFTPRPVELGVWGEGGLREVRSGLKGGEEVVISAQFLLDSESLFREAATKFLMPGMEMKKEGAPPPKPPHAH